MREHIKTIRIGKFVVTIQKELTEAENMESLDRLIRDMFSPEELEKLKNRPPIPWLREMVENPSDLSDIDRMLKEWGEAEALKKKR